MSGSLASRVAIHVFQRIESFPTPCHLLHHPHRPLPTSSYSHLIPHPAIPRALPHLAPPTPITLTRQDTSEDPPPYPAC